MHWEEVRVLLSSELMIRLAIWAGIIVTLASLLLFVLILWMRRVARRRELNHLRAMEKWREILVQSKSVPPVNVPPLQAKELSGFVDVWNELHDADDGSGGAGMRQVATAIGLSAKLANALQLHKSSFHDRVMAIIAMGYMHDAANFDLLKAQVSDHSPIISISAARAMMRVNPERAVGEVMPMIVSRQDWVDGGVAQMLVEAGPDAVAEELSVATLNANEALAPRLVRFLADVSPEAAARVVRTILGRGGDEHLISTCLQELVESADLDKVRPLLSHTRWHVRMHASAAIGRLGQRDDVPLLAPLLADAEWWVRYRTAQALERLLHTDTAALARLRDSQEDRFARDILGQVLAERALGGST